MAEPEQSKSGVVVFYPGKSLKRQVAAWAKAHPEYAPEVSFAKFPPEVLEAIRNAAVVLLDGTQDPHQAAVAFSQAVDQLGPRSVAVYTERVYQWLEMFIRIRGALLLLGPMGETQWDEFFRSTLRSGGRTRGLEPVRAWPGAQHPTIAKTGLRQQRSGNGTSAGHRRPKIGVKPR